MFSSRVRSIAISAVVVTAVAVISSVDHPSQGVAVPARSESPAAEVAPALSATIDPSIFGAAIRKTNGVGYDLAMQAVNGAVGGVAGALAARAFQRRVNVNIGGRPAASTPAQGSADSRFDAPTR